MIDKQDICATKDTLPPQVLSENVFVAGGTDYISTFLKQPTNKQRKNTRGEVNVEVSYTI